MTVLLGIAAAFVVMVLLIQKRISLGLSLLAGGTVVGLCCFDNGQLWHEAVRFAFLSGSTLELAAIILLINMIGCGMSASGSLDRINQSLGRIFPDKRYTVAFFPAIIGMLNVPGGAILSAPLVDRIGGGIGLSAGQKAAANLLFRHFWFPVYPLYTSMIVLSSISGVNMSAIIKLGVPAALVGFFACWHDCFRGAAKMVVSDERRVKAADIYRLFYNLSPVMVALTAALPARAGIIPSLALGVTWTEVINALPFQDGESWAGYLKRRLSRFNTEVLAPSIKWQLIIIPAGINFFRSAISNSGAAELLARHLLHLEIPVEALILLIPALISFITGLHLASVTISAPLFIPMLVGRSLAEPMFLLLMAASVGYWMSPLHLCLILTREYMNAGYAGIVRIMFRPACIIALVGVITYMTARWTGGA